MSAQTQNGFPARVMLTHQRAEKGDRLRRDIQTLQAALRDLRQVINTESLGDLPPLEEITMQWAEGIISSRTDAVFASSVLTGEQKQEAVKQWQKIGRKIKPLASKIEAAVSGYGANRFRYDEAAKTYVFFGIENYLDETCMADVPPEAATHWRLIQFVKTSIESLRSWENDHDLNMCSLLQLVRDTTAEQLAELWADGTIKVNHDFDTPQLTFAREAKRKFEL